MSGPARFPDIRRVLRYVAAGCLCTWTPDNPAASPLYRRWRRQRGAMVPPCPVHPDPPQIEAEIMSPAQKLAIVLAAAGFVIERLITDPDHPWYGGVEVCAKADPGREVVILPVEDGFKARASNGRNDYVGDEPVALVRMVLRQPR